MSCRKIVLEHKLAPGDEVVSTAVVRDIKLTYGEDIQIDFRNNFPSIYENNPYLTPLDEKESGVEHVVLGYKQGISLAAKKQLHFSTYFHIDFTAKTGLPVEPLFSQPDLHLSEYELTTRPISGRYWIVMGGGKSDMTTKHWEYSRYQEVVDRLRPYGLRFVQSGAVKKGHTHPPIDNALNIVGWGGIRQLIWQIAHAEGVICPITCAMHIAAAFNKPCVVIAGGREEPWWEAYVNSYNAFGPKAKPITVEHKYLHTLGLLDCCAVKGCWANKLVPTKEDSRLCKLPVLSSSGQTIPKCLEMITVDHVVEAVMSYYTSGILPPIGTPISA
jgi:hypothetical protein